MARRRALISLHSRPALPNHVRLQYDPVRQAVAVLAPEKVLWPNEVSLDILRHCDGQASVAEIIAALALEYQAEPDEVSGDVIAFLQEWSDRLLVNA